MGPVRRGLTAALALALVPGALRAEVCDKVRPNWEPGTQTTAFNEALFLFSTLPSLILLAATALVLYFRHQWGALIVVVLWTGFVSILAFSGDPTGIEQMAVTEGCVGSPTLFIAAVAAICVAMIFYTAPRPSRG